MKNIIKTLIVMLTSISLFGSAQAGELGVSGTAKATYNLNSGGIWGKRSISGLNDAQHQVVLDGFKSEKARIKKSIKEILSASNN